MSLERTLLSYANRSALYYEQLIPRDHPSIGAAWAAVLPLLTTDLAHLTTDDVTAEEEWTYPVTLEWEANRGLAVPLVMRMPGRDLESHGKHGALHTTRTQVYWCGVPVVPRCCYDVIARELLAAAPDGDIHYFADNLVTDVLRMFDHQQVALPNYHLGHWWAEGGATNERWAQDEANYYAWRSRYALPLHDAPNETWAAWRTAAPFSIRTMIAHTS